MTYERFAELVPAFKLPPESDTSFAEDAIKDAETEVNSICDCITAVSEDCYYADKLCAYLAAYNLLDQQNVVLTGAGFGVVSNDNVAPASKERVEALRKTFEKEITKAYSSIIRYLMHNEIWRAGIKAREIAAFPLYTPAMYEEYGILSEDGEPFTYHTFHQTFTDFSKIEVLAKRLLGEAFYNAVYEEIFTERPRLEYLKMNERLCRYFAALYINPERESEAGQIILAYANAHASEFKEYQITNNGYKNEKKHTTFFFH